VSKFLAALLLGTLAYGQFGQPPGVYNKVVATTSGTPVQVTTQHITVDALSIQAQHGFTALVYVCMITPQPTVSTPTSVTATPEGTVASTMITYKVVANAAVGNTAASAAATTTRANATLTTTNGVLIAWPAVTNAISYTVYRTAAGGTPSTTGVIGTVQQGVSPQFFDSGIAGDGTSAPASSTINTPSAYCGGTGQLSFELAPATSTAPGAQLSYPIPTPGLDLSSVWLDSASGNAAAIVSWHVK
jgi:hypothetical protein